MCQRVMDQYVSDARLQAMAGSGPLVQMDDIELDLFARYACLSAHHEVANTVDTLLTEFQSKPATLTHDQSIQVQIPLQVRGSTRVKRPGPSGMGRFAKRPREKAGHKAEEAVARSRSQRDTVK